MSPRKQTNSTEQSTPPEAVVAAGELFGAQAADTHPADQLTPGASVMPGDFTTVDDPDVRRTTRTEELLVELTRDELLEKGEEFAKLHADLASHEVHAKMARDRLKSDESAITSAIASIADQIRAKKELRKVEVQVVLDFRVNRYSEIRMDTGKEIPGRTRALTDAERKAFLDDRQAKLPLEQAKKSDFTDPLKAASDSELIGAPVNSGKTGWTEDDEHDTKTYLRDRLAEDRPSEPDVDEDADTDA